MLSADLNGKTPVAVAALLPGASLTLGELRSCGTGRAGPVQAADDAAHRGRAAAQR
jgi:hypothetical protein